MEVRKGKSDFGGQLGGFLVGAHQHIDDEHQRSDGGHETDDVEAAGEGRCSSHA